MLQRTADPSLLLCGLKMKFQSRNSLGEVPIIFLKALLKVDFELNPLSRATASRVRWLFWGSLILRKNSSMRY